MYLELKPLEALRHTELAQVAAPWYAVTCLKNARRGYYRIGGFHNAWEACIREIDPHHNHWNHQAHGFERLYAKIEEGDWVVVLDKSRPPLAPAYAQVNGQWQPTRHIREPRARQRLETRVKTLQYEQREAEILQSQNRSATPEVVESGNGPGNRAASLGPHAGMNENKSLSDKTSRQADKSNSGNAKGFPVNDREAEKTFTQALADQKVMLEGKKLALDKWDAPAQADFKTWFGTTNEADREIMRNRIDKTLELNKSYDVSKFQPSSPKNKDAYAYVDPNDAEHRIYLGDPFWSAPASGTDSKAGILSHEMSHFSDVGGTDDFAYGADDAKQLAKENPAQALYNADSFEFYLENAK